MYFYNLTLKQPSVITQAIVGQFSGKRDDYKKGLFEIAIAKGRVLEILKPDETTGKLQSLISVNVFAIIRSIAAFRLTGSCKDYIVLGSESGRIVILEYFPEKNKFEKVHQETFGRSGCRRIVPGQYLACDSKGRAVMIGAVEKQKLVYQLNRDTQANLTISSPLEAHKANTFVFHLINVDVGYENPLFACIEIDYEAADEDHSGIAAQETKQSLTYYELDLGLNHVVRKYSEELDDFSNLLIPVPGGDDGPSGLLVCFENYITYKNFGDQPDIKCPIPRRKGETDQPDRTILISCSATYKYLDGERRRFFFFIQTELGDVFKTEFVIERKFVTEIIMSYFDTLPVATSLCILPHSRRHVEGALLFVAVEAGDHKLYQIEYSEDDETQRFDSKTYQLYVKQQGEPEDNKFFQFKPRPLKNLVLVDEIQSLAPILLTKTVNQLADHRLVMACGSNQNSTLRILKHGLEVQERATSTLPSMATGLWSVKKRCDSIYDEYIVISFINATLVLGIGETIEEIVDSGFLGTKTTIGCTQLGDDSMIQIHPEGIRHIHADKRVNEWRAPLKRQIVNCALNQRQVAIALNNNEILYFEMDITGQLNEANERKEFSSPITCMAIGEVPAGDSRCQFLAVGVDKNVCIISLDMNDCMSEVTRQKFSSYPESISIAELGAGYGFGSTSNLYLNVGLQNGELVRTRLDRISGDLSEPIRRFLGTRPVQLCDVVVKSSHAVLACTNKTWLCYYHQDRCIVSPLSCGGFDMATSFNSPDMRDGIVAISGNSLTLFVIDKLGEVYSQQLHHLECSPRRFEIHEQSGNAAVMMTDRLPLLIDKESHGDRWRSMIKLMNLDTGEVFQEIAYESHQAALCIGLANFGSSNTSLHVGIANNYKLRTQESDSNEIYSYSLSIDGTTMELLHKTSCESIPRAMYNFHDRLVVGLGRIVRMYDLGKKKLLRKCESKQIPFMVTGIIGHSDRLMVSDVQESITFMKYRKEDNCLCPFADDTYPRYIVSSTVMDYNSVAASDKFGNIFVLSLPEDINDDQDDDPTGTKALWDRGWLGGSSQKTETAAITHIGEIVTSMHKTTLSLGKSECLLYTTISGAIGAMITFDDKDDFDLFQTLEMQMRSEYASLCGRDHLAFCSSYFPTKNIVDGDLCERFSSLDADIQDKIADDLERQVSEIKLQLDSMIEKII